MTTMMMPASYAVVSADEMTYLDGGFTMPKVHLPSIHLPKFGGEDGLDKTDVMLGIASVFLATVFMAPALVAGAFSSVASGIAGLFD